MRALLRGRDWIARQRQLVAIECRPKPPGTDDRVVIADTGEMWASDSAWLIILWALADYRHWSYRLASPLLLPTARAAFAKLSAYRGTLSCGLGLSSEAGEQA